MGRKGGDDEATESAIELVGRCAEELGVGTSDMLVSGFAVLDVTVLPIGETVGIGHLRFAEAHSFGERADGAFVQQAADKRLLLLEFGVGVNTPVIIRMPFERMAAQLPDTTLVRFNRDYPQPYQAGIEHFIPFTEDINRIISQLEVSNGFVGDRFSKVTI